MILALDTRGRQRGNMIPETALVISLVLLTLFGLIQYALVGFNQIGADGATFVADHTTVAQYSNPTSDNVNYTQQIALSNFPHATSTYTAAIPKNGTYEVNAGASQNAIESFATTSPTMSIAQLFPSSYTTRSRIIEPAAPLASQSNHNGQCVAATETVVYNGTQLLNSPISLLNNAQLAPPANSLLNTFTDSNGNTAISINGGTITAINTQDSALGTMATDLSATAVQLNTIAVALSPLGLLGSGASNAISAQLAPLVQTAVGGTYSTSAGGTITLTTPLTSAQFAAQVAASTSAIAAIEKSDFLSATVTQAINTAVTTLTTGPPGGSGLLGDMNAEQQVLYTLDHATAKCV